MKSIQFPNMFGNTSTYLADGYNATKQNLELLLLSEKGELFGDPEFGTGLRKYMFDQNDYILRDILIDYIYTAIAKFMPQIKVQRDRIFITSEGSVVKIDIEATNMLNFVTNLYSLVLMSDNT